MTAVGLVGHGRSSARGGYPGLGPCAAARARGAACGRATSATDALRRRERHRLRPRPPGRLLSVNRACLRITGYAGGARRADGHRHAAARPDRARPRNDREQGDGRRVEHLRDRRARARRPARAARGEHAAGRRAGTARRRARRRPRHLGAAPRGDRADPGDLDRPRASRASRTSSSRRSKRRCSTIVSVT